MPWGGGNLGGASLGFMVIKAASVGELPSSNNGTIGIITSSDIKSVTLSNDSISSPAEGDVKLELTISNGCPVNITANGKIKAYPWRATQYLSGLWVVKDMRIRYGGAWVSPAAFLYYNGNEFSAFSGGWQGRSWAAWSGSSSLTPSLTKNADHMLFAGGGGDYYGTAAEIISNIDLTNYNTLTAVLNNVSINSFNSPSQTVHLVVVSRSASYWKQNAAASVLYNDTLNTDQTKSIDVSALNGSYDIVVGFYNMTAAGCSTKIKEVRLAA